MSRSGYYEDSDDQWSHIRWRGAVNSAIRGRTGQRFLREMLAALDALPEKRLITGVLQDEYDPDAVCALGAVGRARGIAGMDAFAYDPEDDDAEWLGGWAINKLGIANALGREIMDLNDQRDTVVDRKWQPMTPELRYQVVRRWVRRQIRWVKFERWRKRRGLERAAGFEPATNSLEG